jgi:tetratricopeptide (TPR) repeat protein
LNKQQWIVAGGGVIILFSLFFFGRTKPHSKGIVPQETHKSDDHNSLDIEDILTNSKKQLTPQQAARITSLENTISRGDLVTQKIGVYGQLAIYWKDSAGQYLPYLWYTGEKAKLEKSEKNLNFAAHSYLDELRGVGDPSLKSWMALQAKDLFTRSLEMNPLNDSTKVGLGSTFFFGAGGDASPMEGIMSIREVATRDTGNMYAQFMLGYGGMISGQLDKAAERFLKVVQHEPGNNEAVFLLAETYERLGDKKQSIYWFTEGKKRVSNPEVIKAIDDKIKSLQ